MSKASGNKTGVCDESILAICYSLNDIADRTDLSFIHNHVVGGDHDFLKKRDILVVTCVDKVDERTETELNVGKLKDAYRMKEEEKDNE